jgi:ABC-type uncharacterized transport system substrate-binding protein
MIRCLAFCLALLAPVVAWAHPHIFIDAGLGFVVDAQGRLTAVRVEWVYDEFYSLLLFEDLGIDADGDMVLTDAELAKLKAQDSDWAPEYEGDLYGSADGGPVALAPPVDFDLRIEDGKIVSRHTRPLVEPLAVAGHAVSFQSYDPGYYAAFTLERPVTVEGGTDCRVERFPADRRTAKAKLERLLREMQSSDQMEVQFPAVGADFADTARLTCGGG